jgi:hypothetical protein
LLLGEDTLLDISDEQQQENDGDENTETKQDFDDDENEEDNLQEYYEIELNDDPTDAPHHAPSEAQRRCKTCRVLFSTKAFAAHRLSHPTHFRAQKKLLFCCLCELDFKAGLAIKNPPKKTHPKKPTQKNRLKKITKNGVFGFF